MEKEGDVRSGGSSQLGQTGGVSDGVLDKSSTKEKLRRLSSVGKISEMDQLSHSNATNSTSKRVKLPKKFFDRCGSINHASVPRKLRSAMKKRQYESEKISAVAVSPVLQDSRNRIGTIELPSKDCTKKLKTTAEEHEISKTSPRDSVITKDEADVAEALFALAQTFPNANLNEPSEAEPSLLPGSLFLRESMHTEPQHEADNAKDVSNGKKSRKRCSVHVYICRLIKVLQTTESNEASVDKGSKQGARVNVRSNTNPDEIMNEYQTSREAENVHKRLFQEQQQAFDIVSLVAGGGCGVEGSNVADGPETMTEAASTQLQDHTGMHLTNPQNHYLSGFDGHLSAATEQVLPYFDTMHYDHSRWSTQMMAKHQSWENQFISGSCHQNWRNRRHDAMTPLSGSSLEMFGSKSEQGSLVVLGSKHTLNEEQLQQQQQCIPMSSLLASDKGKMQFSRPPSSYDNKGGLFFVDSGPMLKLTL